MYWSNDSQLHYMQGVFPVCPLVTWPYSDMHGIHNAAAVVQWRDFADDYEWMGCDGVVTFLVETSAAACENGKILLPSPISL